MTERIIARLKADKDISDFRLNIQKRQSYELFFVHRDLETVRSTDTEDIKVTVFVNDGDKLGDASFPVYTSYSDEMISAEIQKAKKRAALALNPCYPLPENESGIWESDSNFKNYDMNVLAAEIAKQVFSAESECEGAVNALEVFVYRDEISVINSLGINKTETRYSAMAEAIPTWNGTEESVELYDCYNFTEFDPQAVSKEIRDNMKMVRDRLSAKTPEVKLACPVVFCSHELDQLFFELASNLNYAAVYKHINAFSKGDAIQNAPAGDKLTVTMMGSMPGGTASAIFDTDGCAAADSTVISDGVAQNYYGSVRYAYYLNEKPTGELKCLRVDCGTLSPEELNKKPYFRCASMSGLQVDVYNDYIGGEVRLAYYFDGEKEIPLTGISVSGKLSAALSAMRLSTVETTRENYKGPSFGVFENIEII
ncbi:MAG: hypothetical protein IKZ19_03420 [Clostridia bacterium]|nr:hypothetical protein [Clostridia bacterium]